MHDIKFIRENPEALDKALENRGLPHESKNILELDKDRRDKIVASENALSYKNEATRRTGEAKAAGNTERFEEMRKITASMKKTMAELESQVITATDKLLTALRHLPNSPMDDVPIGKDENDNKEIRCWGEIPIFDDIPDETFPKEHFDITSVSKGMDFERAAKMSGSRFVLLSGAIARVHRALAQFMLDLHINEHELTEINAPVIVNSEAMRGTGQLPKFADDCYKTGQHQWLIPTSEVSLTNIVADKILKASDLPKRYCAHSLCFRKEAGSAGRDTTGMLRQHQFEKVEMVSIMHPDESREELDRMTERAENVLKELGLPFRTVVLCTGDMGFSAQRTHDIEVWLPGQNRYREISSVSVCGDFQARRMFAQYREKDGDKPQFVHTLNGSGVAVGRCLIAVLENGQQKDGSVKLPEVLHPYLGYNDTINRLGLLQKTTGK